MKVQEYTAKNGSAKMVPTSVDDPSLTPEPPTR